MAKNESVTYRVQRLESLYSAVIADSLDHFGVRDRIMNHSVRPIRSDMVVAGRAMPMLAVEIHEIPEEPYQKEFEAVDSLKPNDVAVATTNGAMSFAFWGELLATSARARGALGAVVDGCCRDTRRLLNMDFPTFCSGYHPADTKGRSEVIDFNCTIKCGGVVVNPGDYVLGDIDGVVVIPSDIVDNVLDFAEEKVAKEGDVRRELEAGRTVTATYNKYKVM